MVTMETEQHLVKYILYFESFYQIKEAVSS